MDCAIQSNTSAICTDDFAGCNAEAFALYRTFQAAISCSLFFMTGPLFSADNGKVATDSGLLMEINILLINLGLAGVGWVLYTACKDEESKVTVQ